MPYTELIDAGTGCMRSDKEIAAVFRRLDVDTTLPVVNSCGSGVTACIVDLGLRIVGSEKSTLYDGSWAEYVSHSLFKSLFCIVLELG